MDDAALLEEFISKKSEAAFQTLVERHSALVYGVCARGLSAADAEDAAQAVFIILAQKAPQLRTVGSLSGWLHRTAQFTVSETRRQTQRRILREQRATGEAERGRSMEVEPSASDTQPFQHAEEIRTQLDAAIASLREKQQDAVVLHYLQGKSLKDSAAALRCSEDAVKKRIEYGLEKLRAFFAKRGISLAAAGLVTAMQSEAQRAAPAGLAKVCAASGLSGLSAAKSGAIAKGAMKMMFWTKIKIAAALPALLAVSIGIGSATHVWSADKPLRISEQPREEMREPVKGAVADPSNEPAWDANPFEGTESITVVHGAATFEIKDAEIVKKLLKTITIYTIDNGMSVGAEPSSAFTFHRGVKGDFVLGLTSGALLMIPSGVMNVDQKFWAAINQQLTAQTGKPVDVLQFEPVPAKNGQHKQLTVDSMKSGFKSAKVLYELGGRPREIQISDPDDLKALSKAFIIIRETKRDTNFHANAPKWAEFNAETSDGALLNATFVDSDELRTYINNIKVLPDFPETLSRIASRFEGRAINILFDNPLTHEEMQAAAKLDKMLRDARHITIVSDERGREANIEMDTAATQKSFEKLKFVATLPQAFKSEPAGLRLKLTPGTGEPFTITFMKDEGLSARVGLASPVEISGFGQAWISDQWQYAFSSHRDDVEQQRKHERAALITARVLKDFPAFIKQVISMQIGCDAAADGHIHSFPSNSLERMQLMKLLTIEKATEDTSASPPERSRATLTLVPGIGYDLRLPFVDNRKAVVDGWGTIEFKNNIGDEIERIVKGTKMVQETVKPPAPPDKSDF